MIKPEISVVMPVYNGEKYLEEAIISVLDQSFTNFEFIIINDGSTDRSEKIILSFKDYRIKYHKQENQGIGAALRNGCNLAQGKYIARMDADDICYPNRFEMQYKFLEENKEYVLVSNSVYYIDVNGDIFGRSFPYSSNSAIKRILKLGSVLNHPSVMMRKEAYFSAGGYLDLQPLEDWFMWIKLSSLGKFHNLRNPLLYYRILNSSISRSISEEDYSKLRSFLFSKRKSLHESEIIEFQKMYSSAKKTYKQSKSFSNCNKPFSPNKFETIFFQIMNRIRIPLDISEKIICGFKNTYSYRYLR